MKSMLCLAVFLATGLVLRADDDARKAIDRAIAAAGQVADAHKKAIAWKGKGTFYGMGMEVPYAGSWAVQYPDKYRMEIENVVTIVVNGDKGWISAGGEVREIPKQEITEHHESLHADMVSELSSLADKAYTLKLLGDGKVEDKATVAVKVFRQGRRDVTLHFDKASGMLVKMDQLIKDETGKEMTQETFYKAYEMQGKTKVPSKILVKRDGMNFVDGEMSDYKVSDKLPAATFDKP